MGDPGRKHTKNVLADPRPFPILEFFVFKIFKLKSRLATCTLVSLSFDCLRKNFSFKIHLKKIVTRQAIKEFDINQWLLLVGLAGGLILLM